MPCHVELRSVASTSHGHVPSTLSTPQLVGPNLASFSSGHTGRGRAPPLLPRERQADTSEPATVSEPAPLAERPEVMVLSPKRGASARRLARRDRPKLSPFHVNGRKSTGSNSIRTGGKRYTARAAARLAATAKMVGDPEAQAELEALSPRSKWSQPKVAAPRVNQPRADHFNDPEEPAATTPSGVYRGRSFRANTAERHYSGPIPSRLAPTPTGITDLLACWSVGRPIQRGLTRGWVGPAPAKQCQGVRPSMHA